MKIIEEPTLHPTAQKLVDTVIEMVKTTSYDSIKSENVLVKSGVTRGPMYHHFADFDDLIETAQSQIYKNFAFDLITQLVVAINASEDMEKARAKFYAFIEDRTVEISDNSLRQRIGIIHSAASRPSLRQRLSQIQEDVTQEWMHAYEMALARGWADPKIDTRSVAILMQSTFTGRVLDGMSNVHMEREEWIKVLWRLFDSFFFVRVSTNK